MKIFERALRIAIAAALAILIASLLNLKNTYSAGIVALLTVLDTKRASFKAGRDRIISILIAYSLAAIIFKFLGFSVTSFFVFLLAFVPISIKLDISAGISPSSVLVTHLLIAESIGWSWLLNGVLLMIIGVLSALFIQVWIPSYSKQIKEARKHVEKDMQEVLYLLGQHLTNPKDISLRLLNDKLNKLSTELSDLEELSRQDYDNKLWNSMKYDLDYTLMRKRQLEEMKRMFNLIQAMSGVTPQNNLLAELFHKTAEEFDESNTGIELLELLQELYRYYRQSELPKTREEFENRAILYQLLLTFERFLEIKRDFYIEYSNNNG